MSTSTALHPRRELVLPALVVAAPLLYFAIRDASIAVATGAGAGLRHLGFLAGSLLVGYAVGVALVAVVDVDRLVGTSAAARAVFRPSTVALTLVAVFVLGTLTYLVATVWIDAPWVLDAALMPVGVTLGLPLIAAQIATYALGDALGREPAMWLQFVAVGIGVALSALWTVLVATRLAGLLDSV